MDRSQIQKGLSLASLHRFPRLRDKIANLGMMAVAGSTILFSDEGDGADQFVKSYRESMPWNMIINYAGGDFRARKDHYEIHLLNKASEDYNDVFCPQEGDVVVDIGAHAGKYTIPSANVVGDEGHVIAFEPVVSHYAALWHNISLNGLDNVTARNVDRV